MTKVTVETREGSRMDDMYVLTQAELNRIVARYQDEIYQRLRVANEKVRYYERKESTSTDMISHRAYQARKATYRKNNQVRYQRYKRLLEHFGERSAGARWTSHLSELDKRFSGVAA